MSKNFVAVIENIFIVEHLGHTLHKEPLQVRNGMRDAHGWIPSYIFLDLDDLWFYRNLSGPEPC